MLLQTRAKQLHAAAEADKSEVPPEGYTSNSNKEVRAYCELLWDLIIS